jgi:uncharacterized protein YbjT (DUF2867 family)
VAERKVIVVTGATGAQGGGLARAILAEPEAGYTVRALTRDAHSEAARALAEAGAEIVSADLDDPASLERAFEGAYGAYCVTFFWAHFSPEREQSQARSMAQAAKSAGLRHVIWSTLEDTRRWLKLDDPRMPTLMERYKVPHFDAKGESDEFFRQAGVPTTFLLTSYYWDNLIHFGMGPKPGPDGTLLLALPMGDRKLPGIAAEDIGRCAWGIFKQGEGLAGRTIGIAGEHLTGVAGPGTRPRGSLCRNPAGCVSRARVPGIGRPRQHVPVQARLQRRVLRGKKHRDVALAEPAADEFRRLAERERGEDPAHLAGRAAASPR